MLRRQLVAYNRIETISRTDEAPAMPISRNDAWLIIKHGQDDTFQLR